MDLLSIILLAIGLAMDCFAVSIAQGMQGGKWRQVTVLALLFGLFQGGMPLITYFAGKAFADFFTRWSPWIALVLLVLIGGKMIVETIVESYGVPTNLCSGVSRKSIADSQDPKAKSEQAVLTLGTMLVLAVATSIDALSIGVLFIPIPEVLWLAIGIIAATSFAFSLVGFELGKRLGKHLPVNANIVGGCILIAIGVKIFLEGILA